MDQKEIRRYLNVIKRATSCIETMLDADDGGLLEQMLQPTQVTQQLFEQIPGVNSSPPSMPTGTVAATTFNVLPPITKPSLPIVQPLVPVVQSAKSAEELAARQKHIESLLAIDCWPEAVPQFLTVAPTVEDQLNRANAVLDMMLDGNIAGMNFLDFGCGDGWVAQQAINRGVAESCGYDIVASENWQQMSSATFVDDFSKLKKHHYDIILLYDVLDHVFDPLGVMAQLKQLIKKDSRIYIACHPWTSKHAMHLYKQGINKAYIHWFLTWDEISELIGQKPTFTRPEKNAIEAYRWWFKDFDIQRENFVKKQVSPFFYVQSFKELVANEQQIPLAEIDNFLKLAEIEFVYYKLQLK